jgi:hypothetical protein
MLKLNPDSPEGIEAQATAQRLVAAAIGSTGYVGEIAPSRIAPAKSKPVPAVKRSEIPTLPAVECLPAT